ncbi:unnamed protein product [Ectocarpus sp. 8 AP-2014]
MRKLQCCNVFNRSPVSLQCLCLLQALLVQKGTEVALNAGMSTVGGEPVLLHKLRLIARGLVSKDYRGPYVETRTPNAQRPPARLSRGSPRWSRIIVLTLVVSVIHTSLAENNKTSEASELTCASSEPHFVVKVAIVVLMLGLFYWANRIFDKLDEASYARLSRALSRRAHARQRAGWARRR